MKNANRKSEKAEINKMKHFIKENMRLGASKDYAEGYKQAVKDCKRKHIFSD